MLHALTHTLKLWDPWTTLLANPNHDTELVQQLMSQWMKCWIHATKSTQCKPCSPHANPSIQELNDVMNNPHLLSNHSAPDIVLSNNLNSTDWNSKCTTCDHLSPPPPTKNWPFHWNSTPSNNHCLSSSHYTADQHWTWPVCSQLLG